MASQHTNRRQPKDVNEYHAVCQGGLEQILASELESLGLDVISQGNRIVRFEATTEGLYRANMAVRTALSIMLPIKRFRAPDYDRLYLQARKIAWEKIFDVSKTIRIDVKGTSHLLDHSQFVTHRVKDAISDTFRRECEGRRPSVEKRAPQIHVVVYLSGDAVTLYLDSSGVPLFKRGYRVEHGTAPLKEDLAAGLLMLSDWDRETDIIDPMCGSGTLLFEAYMMARRMPPNLYRDFSFKHWHDFDPFALAEANQRLRKQIRPAPCRFYGYESDPKTADIASRLREEHFNDDAIEITPSDFRASQQAFPKRFVITNPPYGERLDADGDIGGLYEDLGEFLRERCPGSKASVFTANMEAAKKLFIKASRRIPLLNGALDARLLKFDIFDKDERERLAAEKDTTDIK